MSLLQRLDIHEESQDALDLVDCWQNPSYHRIVLVNVRVYLVQRNWNLRGQLIDSDGTIAYYLVHLFLGSHRS